MFEATFFSEWFAIQKIFLTVCSSEKDQWNWDYLGRHNGYRSVGLTVLIPQK